jgi:hypothetical protein
MRAADDGEGAVEEPEGDRGGDGEDTDLEQERLPEDAAVAEGLEPEEVDPGRESVSANDERDEQDGGEEDEAAAGGPAVPRLR